MSATKTQRCQRRPGRGFTLVEIMIVVLIIGVLLNIAAPAFVHARDEGQTRACVSNLHNINTAKEEWALQDNIGPDQVPVWTDIQPYIHSTVAPVCPATGLASTYSYNAISTLPTCSYGGPAGQPSLAHTF